MSENDDGGGGELMLSQNGDSNNNNKDDNEDGSGDDPWIPLGGGAVNEKKRTHRVEGRLYRQRGESPPPGKTTTPTSDRQQQSQSRVDAAFDPVRCKSHLWHALEGLDRYPNYLSRFADDDDGGSIDADDRGPIGRLEQALELQLAKVRQQRGAVRDRRRGIAALVDELSLRTTTTTLVSDRAVAKETDERRQEGGAVDDDDDEGYWSDFIRAPDTWEELERRDILDPRLRRCIFGSKMFNATKKVDKGGGDVGVGRGGKATTLREVLEGRANVELDVGSLTELMEEEFTDVYSLPVLSRNFCRRVCRYVLALAELGQSTEEYRELRMGRYPTHLDDVGLRWLNDLLFHLVMRPISRHLFSSTECMGGDLDWRHGFIAGYSASPDEGKPRERLVTHTDDSEVTLNLCLGGDDFEGGEVRFRGLRGAAGAADDARGGGANAEENSFPPVPGTALLHAGRHFHDVSRVTSGDRFALIVWARSFGGIRSRTCPCCWMNRRTDSACICGPRWN